MRKLRQRAIFKSDLKRGLRGTYRKILMPGGEFQQVINALRNDTALPTRYRDHSLRGKFEGCRECHIRPDLLLVYKYEGDDVMVLERLGSHSELFGM